MGKLLKAMGKAARLKKEKKAAKDKKNPATVRPNNGVGSGVSEGDLDFSAPEDAFTGTFRWGPAKRFLALPPAPKQPVSLTKRGWGDYLEKRCPGVPDICDAVKADPSVLDCLTYPVTIAHMLHMV